MKIHKPESELIEHTAMKLAAAFYETGKSQGLTSKYKDATIVATVGSHIPKPNEAPKLQLLHLFSAGIDMITESPLFLETDVPITCT